MGFHNNGLRATALATLVAIAGVSAFVAPVAAIDPSPTPTPAVTPSPTPALASPTATIDPAAPTADPAAPAPTPAPIVTPSPTVVPEASPSLTIVPAPITTTPAPAVVVPAVVAPVVRPNLAAKVVRIALAQRGKRYVFGASGPRAFDCSGLVRYVYRMAGVSSRIGGGHSARGMLIWARRHHLVSRSNPRVGDLVIYGNGSHVAIYIGRGLVVSALNPRQGIRVTRLHALRARVTAIIHTHL